MPGELGEVLPRSERLTLPPRSERFAPDYAVRGFLTSWQDFLPGGGWIPADLDAILDWALRNRFNAVWWGGGNTEDFGAHRGYGHEQTSNHSYSGLVRADTLFDAHPEWFPLVDGQRNPLHSSGRPNELCVSNPEMAEHVTQQALAYFQSHPRARAFAVNHDDEPAGWCACADCRALDVRPVDWSLNGRDVLPLTDRVVAFVNRVAARVAEQYPDRLIEMYAYGSTHDPPQRETVHPNVLVKCCLGPSELCLRHGVFDPACARNREFVARFRAWGQRASHLGIYNYLDYYYAETPACWYSATAEQFRSLHQLGVEQVLGETSNTFTGSALWFYLLGRVLWDVDTDSEAVIDDFCTHFYGPAAEPMAEYYRTLERAVREDAERAGEENQTCNNLRRFTPEIVAAARAALERATAAAGEGGEEEGRGGQGREGEGRGGKGRERDLLQARIDRAWFSLLFTETTRIAEVGPHTEEAFAHGREAFARMKEIQQRRNLCGTRASATRLQWFYVPPLQAQNGELLAALPLVWKFRRDPDDQGEAAGWPGTKPDENWTDIRTDASWTDQGHAYHGVAWYTTTVAVPDFPAGRTVWLLFGAVDGDCWVWIDGQPAGKQVEDVSLMWDKPFALDVTGLIRPGMTQRMTVKVFKDRFAAGIWKPVELRLERGRE
jgi:hypothetical protein